MTMLSQPFLFSIFIRWLNAWLDSRRSPELGFDRGYKTKES